MPYLCGGSIVTGNWYMCVGYSDPSLSVVLVWKKWSRCIPNCFILLLLGVTEIQFCDFQTSDYND